MRKKKCTPVMTPCTISEAIDPCGCCHHCAKAEELCGGPDWKFGYCAHYYKCAAINGTGLVEIPDIGACKDRRTAHYREDDDENCPEYSDFYRIMGTCNCGTKRTCIPHFDFPQYNPQDCDFFYRYDEPDMDHRVHIPCTRYGCHLVDNQCICGKSGCDHNCTFKYSDGRSCEESGCAPKRPALK